MAKLRFTIHSEEPFRREEDIETRIPRNLDWDLYCHCGGELNQSTPTEEEIHKHGCGRELAMLESGSGYMCCARSYECSECGRRFAGRREAPEMG